MNENKNLVTRKPALKQDPNDRLMEIVLQGNNIEILERFIALREREEARTAQQEFELHFSAMQAELPVVPRIKQGYGYKYAPLEVIQQVCGPVIAKHGFSYRWKEDMIEQGGKRCTMIISGWGHSKENSFDVPKMTGTAQMNPIQLMGVLSTYGKRYTFTSGFGVTMVDEDSDGVVTGEQDEELQALLVKAKSAGCGSKELAEIRERYANMKGSKTGLPKLIKMINEELDQKLSRKPRVVKGADND